MRTFYQFLCLLYTGHINCQDLGFRIVNLNSLQAVSRSWGSGQWGSLHFYLKQPPVSCSCRYHAWQQAWYCQAFLLLKETRICVLYMEVYQLKRRFVLQKGLWRGWKATDRQKIFANHMSNKRLVSRLYNKRSKLDRKNIYREKMGKICKLTVHWRRYTNSKWAQKTMFDIISH